MTNQHIYLTANKYLYVYKLFTKNSSLQQIKFNSLSYNWLMGITKHKDVLYVGGNNCIINTKTNKAFLVDDRRNNVFGFHHIKYTNGKIIAPATTTNQLFVFDEDFKIEKIVDIAPPEKTKPMQKHINYNHLNGIHYNEGFYYVDLNWLTQTQFSSSGVAVLDENFKELDRFEYGWQTHGFCIIDDKKYVLCGCNKTHPIIYHPNVGGLMVDGEIKYEVSDNWFCKNFSVDDEFIYIVGGNCSHRAERNKVDSILIVLDKDYNEVDKLIFEGIGEIKGCLLENIDYTDK